MFKLAYKFYGWQLALPMPCLACQVAIASQWRRTYQYCLTLFVQNDICKYYPLASLFSFSFTWLAGCSNCLLTACWQAKLVFYLVLMLLYGIIVEDVAYYAASRNLACRFPWTNQSVLLICLRHRSKVEMGTTHCLLSF